MALLGLALLLTLLHWALLHLPMPILSQALLQMALLHLALLHWALLGMAILALLHLAFLQLALVRVLLCQLLPLHPEVGPQVADLGAFAVNLANNALRLSTPHPPRRPSFLCSVLTTPCPKAISLPRHQAWEVSEDPEELAAVPDATA
jgi:hypothetical protein